MRNSYLFNQYTLFLGLILCSFCIHSCLDEISLNIPDGNQILIVNGTIVNGIGPHSVNIRTSANFTGGAEGVELPVSGADVKIKEIGGQDYRLQETDQGIYTTSEITAYEGNVYMLIISLNGNEYISQPEMMPPAIHIDSLGFEVSTELINSTQSQNLVEQDIITIKANSNFSSNEKAAYAKYKVNGTFEFLEKFDANRNRDQDICFIQETIDLDQLVLVNKADLNQGLLKDQPIIKKTIDYRFAYRYCFTVIQESLSSNTYNFWKTVENEYNRTGDIFESPPSTIKGNIFNSDSSKNDIIGIFSAINRDSASILINSTQVGAPPQFCRSFRAPDVCFNCLQISKSSLIKPTCFQ